jgi:C-terminal processing protease CtpA/Prc
MRTLVFSLLLLLLGSPSIAANSSKNFGGIGIDGAPWADGRIVVKQIVAGGPAHLAGIKVGDVITFIDGKPTEGSNFREMVDHRLRGVAGTPVTLKIRRPGSARLITFKLVRRQLVIPPKSAKKPLPPPPVPDKPEPKESP